MIDLALATPEKASARTLLPHYELLPPDSQVAAGRVAWTTPQGPYSPYAPLQHSASHGEVTDGLRTAFGRG